MTRFSPFFLATGIQARLPSDVLASIEKRLSLRDGDTLPFSEALAELYDLVCQRLQASAAKCKKAFDQNQLDVSFDIGSTVMVYSKEAHHRGDSTKFASHWVGPYTVTEMVTPVTYRLQHVHTGKPALAHVNQLRKIPAYKSPADNFTAVGAPFVNLDDDTGSLNWTKSPGNVEPTSGPAPLSSSEDGQPSFEMESILWKCCIGSKTQYLVKFHGYST